MLKIAPERERKLLCVISAGPASTISVVVSEVKVAFEIARSPESSTLNSSLETDPAVNEKYATVNYAFTVNFPFIVITGFPPELGPETAKILAISVSAIV
jgi:hypothetical protein